MFKIQEVILKHYRSIILSVIVLLMSFCLSPIAAENVWASPIHASSGIEGVRQATLPFVNHVQAGMAEPDVYIETDDGMVRRMTAEEADDYMDAPVFTVAIANDHDPFGVVEGSGDPRESGFDLGFTMADWLGASGELVYTVSGNDAQIDAHFENLVPGGVYTLWCSTVATPPDFHIVNIPCGDPYGGDNVFTADEDGSAQASVKLHPLSTAREDLIPMVAVAYHSDGNTYDEYPGSFGLNTHVQIFAPIPPADNEAWGPIPSQQATLPFVNHVQAGMAEPDVYIETEDGMVRRMTAEEADDYMDAPVFTVAIANDHDPFSVVEGSGDPRESGYDLGITMADWLGASGELVYTVSGNDAQIDAHFEDLVPGGVYTLWCSTVATPPDFHIVNIPCGDPYGGDNVFTADDDGSAQASVLLHPLSAAREDLIPMVAVAYHSDGNTYDEYPGSFGLNAHVQIFAPIPPADNEAWGPIPSQQATLPFINHVQAGMAEPDVYIETEDGMVRRMTAEEADAYMEAPIFTIAAANEHDPFGVIEGSGDPREVGFDLDISMAEWLAASGELVYTVEGNDAQMEMSFDGLIPGGVYTLWCSTVATPPDFHIVNIPCGDPYGGDNVFTADDDGSAQASVALNTMSQAREDLIPMVAVAYHSDGNTYDEYPGNFGLNAHVQIFAPIPPADNEAWVIMEQPTLR